MSRWVVCPPDGSHTRRLDGFGVLLALLVAAIAVAPARASDGNWTSISNQPPSPPSTPFHRDVHTMVLDRDTQQLIVFGGIENNLDGTKLADVWLGTLPGLADFQSPSVPGAPAARYGHGAIYDPVRHRMVVAGGDATGITTTDLWEFTPSPPHWGVIPATGAPPKLWATACTYDSRRDRLLVFGGYGPDPINGPFHNDVYAYSFATATWTQLLPGGARPSLRDYASVAYDSLSDWLVVFGGNGVSGTVASTTYVLDFNTGTWGVLPTTGGPPSPRYASGTAFDQATRSMYVFGGINGGWPDYDDLWRLDVATGTWAVLPRTDHPTPRHSVGMVFDAAAHRIIVHGGRSNGISRDDLWVYDLSNPGWTRLSGAETLPYWVSPAPPPFRYGQAIARDDVHDLVVMFGGDMSNRSFAQDVFAVKLTPPQGEIRLLVEGAAPQQLLGATMLPDTAHQRILMFGGLDLQYPTPPAGRVLMNELWSLNLSPIRPRWQQLSTTGTPPSPRNFHTATYDPIQQRMIVIGGQSSAGVLNDVWSLDLATLAWSPLFPAGTPPAPRMAHGAAYDPIANRILVYGGAGNSSTLGDLWALQLSPLEWVPLNPPGPSPGPRYGHGFELDPAIMRIVEYGGTDGTTTFGDVRTLSLTDPIGWSLLDITGGPPTARLAAGFVYDPPTNTFLLNSGVNYPDGLNGTLGDSWLLSLTGLVTLAVPPGSNGTRLEGFSPNPARGDPRVAFTLADASPAHLELIDVSGRRVASRDMTGMAAGRHVVDLAGSPLEPGVYFIRLTQGAKTSTARGVRMR